MSTAVSTAAAWTWVDHLRSGGTTAWTDWLSSSRDVADPRSGDRLLPGAQQLELLRRLNLVARPDPELVERVLVASAPGRGRQDLELLGAVEPLAFGPRPVDPGALTVDELVRVAVGLIAEDVVDAAPADQGAARVRRWRTRYRLAGDPWLTDAMRTDLVAQGRPPGGRGAVVAVVFGDLGTMLAHDWLARCFGDGSATWEEYCQGLERRNRLPSRLRLPLVAQQWAERQGGDSFVRVVTDPGRVAKVVGTRRLAVLPPVSRDGAELARRVTEAVGLLVTRPRRSELMRQVLRPRLLERSGPPPVVPEQHRAWVEQQADRMVRRLSARDYAVVGDLDALRPRWPEVRGPREEAPEVLEPALDLLLRPPAQPNQEV